MAISGSGRLMLAVVVVLVVVGLIQSPAQAQAQQCPGLDIGGLISECQQYVQKSGPRITPSAQCCGVVRNINLPCACKYVNKDVEKLVSVKKVVYVAQYCGLALKHGSKCGKSIDQYIKGDMMRANPSFLHPREDGISCIDADKPTISIQKCIVSHHIRDHS
ncbi:hypothetical protein V2J09_012084 [Rumex salicifolius]